MSIIPRSRGVKHDIFQTHLSQWTILPRNHEYKTFPVLSDIVERALALEREQVILNQMQASRNPPVKEGAPAPGSGSGEQENPDPPPGAGETPTDHLPPAMPADLPKNRKGKTLCVCISMAGVHVLKATSAIMHMTVPPQTKRRT